MTPAILIGLLIFGIISMTLAGCAHQVIHEMQWHDLEEYCERKRSDVFGKVLDLKDQLALGTLMAQMVAIGIAISSLIFLLLDNRIAANLEFGSLAAIMATSVFSLVVFCSWIPWAVAQVAPTPFLFHTWRLWWVISAVAWPLVVGARFVSKFFSRASGLPFEEDDEEEAIEDEILSIVSEGEHDGHIEKDTADMIEGVMELDDNEVRRIMTPRSRVDSLDINTDWEDMLTYVVESGRTRIPVYEEKFDNVVGILYAKDLLRESLRSEGKRRSLKKLLRTPLVAPESKLLDEMLQEFLSQRSHMAIVKDEYGAFSGVITIEDILEEIVGEIVDETDDEEIEEIRMIDKTTAEVVGTTQIDRLNEKLGLQLPEDDEFATVSGLLVHKLNEIPRRGREYKFDNVEFKVEQSNRRFVEVVTVRILSESEMNGNGHSE